MKTTPATLLAICSSLLIAPSLKAQEPAFQDRSFDFSLSISAEANGGVAFLDYDQDGDEDLFIPGVNGKHQLLRNDGHGFADVTELSGIQATAEHGYGATVGDYDQDGYPDIYVTCFGPNLLLRNQGNGSFVDVAPALGITGGVSWTSAASWADFDRDGDLDLYLGNFNGTGKIPYLTGEADMLFVNLGSAEAPEFIDQAEQLGVQGHHVLGAAHPDMPYPLEDFPDIGVGTEVFARTLSVSTADFDGDGDQDILTGHDWGEFMVPNRLYRNDSDGGNLVFTDVSTETNYGHYPHFNMGVNPGDYDNDGDLDFYMSNLGDNLLLDYDPITGKFSDLATAAGALVQTGVPVEEQFSSWASMWMDVDNDGFQDLIVCNGGMDAAGGCWPVKDREENRVFHNRGDGSFAMLSDALSGVADAGPTRGGAAADVNGDGRVDFVSINVERESIWQVGDHSRLQLNAGTLGDRRNQFCSFRLEGVKSNREGIGATLHAEVQGRRMMRQVLADPVFLSSSSRVVHFGLGRHPSIDRLTVNWPSGRTQELIDVPAGVTFPLVEPSVTVVDVPAPTWSGSSVDFSIAFDGRLEADPEAVVIWVVHAGEGGPRLGLATSRTPILGNRSTAVLSVPITADRRLALQGQEIEIHAYLVGDRGIDCRRVLHRLP